MTIAAALGDVLGPGELYTGAAMPERFLVEERGLFRSAPIAVVAPTSVAALSKLLATCNTAGMPVVPQGGNTGLCGGAVAGRGGDEVLLSTSRLRDAPRIDPLDQTGVFSAGTTLLEAKEAARAHGLDLPLSYGSEGTATIGGAVATNAGGMDAIRHGPTRSLVRGLTVVLADGRILDLSKGLLKDNTGYDLVNLFVGSEGTLGVIASARLALARHVPNRSTAALAVSSIQDGLRLLEAARAQFDDGLLRLECLCGAIVALTESQLSGHRPLFETSAPWTVMLEVGRVGSALGADLEQFLERAFEDGLVIDGVVAQSTSQADDIWHLRDAVIEAQKRDGASIKHDISVPIAALPEFLDRADAIVEEVVPGARPMPFGHLGDGNIHYNVQQPPGPWDQGFLDHWDPLADRIHALVMSLGGSFSAEHGVGLLKVRELERHSDPVALDLMRQIKTVLDPEGIMNPGKVLARQP